MSNSWRLRPFTSELTYYSYATVQRAQALTGPWTPITTVTISNIGYGTSFDAKPPAGTAFYRITYP